VVERVTVERVTGIEPALSAWESDRSEPLTSLSWATDAPLVTVMNPMTPWLMARQWPGDLVERQLHDDLALGTSSALSPRGQFRA
jgi:hypothetical protein